MNQAEFTKRVAERSGDRPHHIARVFEAMAYVLAQQLAIGDTVRTPLGTFVASERAATTGRNPRTGEPIAIAAKRSVRCKPAKALRDAVLRGQG